MAARSIFPSSCFGVTINLCRPSTGKDHIASSSMRATERNRRTFTSNEMIAKRSFGLIPYFWNEAAVFLEARSIEFWRLWKGAGASCWTDGMTTSTTESRSVFATSVTVTDEGLTVDLSDGRSLTVPLAWYPRLLHASAEERGSWRLIGQGSGIHWPRLDEDLSVKNLLDGKPSGESHRSLKAWLDRRTGDSIL